MESLQMAFETDSGDYEFITEAIAISANVDGIVCEIGTRLGGSLKYILDAVYNYCPTKSVICIDPYGSIEYQGREGKICRLDYTNQMKYECMKSVYSYLCEKPVDFHYYDVTDEIFFVKYSNGIDLFDLEHSICNKYSFVLFDGPHYIEAIKSEIDFFNTRTNKGATFVFDDVTIDFYDHAIIDEYLIKLGWVLYKIGNKKAIYIKEK